MKRLSVCGIVAVAATMLSSSSVVAQSISPQCPPGTVNNLGVPDNARATQDACQKAIDLFQFLAPQLGTVIAGGNATIGQGGTLGGLGHVTLSARANITSGTIPQIDKVTPSTSGAVQSDYTTKSQVIGLPQVDAAIGLFKGIPLGLTSVGGFDLLVSAAYLPSVSSGSVSVDVPNGSLKLGFGGRLGLLQESTLTPGVSVTYLQRGLPTVNIRGTSGSDSLRINGLSLKTHSWRLVANKNLFILGVAGGVGQDTYKSDGSISAYVAPSGLFPGGNSQTVALSQDLTRTNYFFDLLLNLKILKIVGEVGQVSGGTVNTYNTFGGARADDSRTYGSLGLRFGL